MVLSHAFTIWIVFGSTTIDKPPKAYLPLSIDGCNNQSFSEHTFPDVDLRPNFLRNSVQWTNGTDLRGTYQDVEEASLPGDR